MSLQEEKIGIVLMNTGTPDSPSPSDIRPYLIEFLSDRNLIKMPPIVWQPILRLCIARTRPKKTSPRYEEIWTPEGSPLLVETQAQCAALNARFAETGLNAVAAVGMRYGNPGIAHALQQLEAAGCRTIIGFPLFPQTSFCTVKTCKEKLQAEMKAHPRLRLAGVIEGYEQNPHYVKALACSIRDAWDYQPGSKILFSFHSIPLADVEAGDAYVDQIESGMERLACELGLARNDWAIAFHSRFEDSRTWVSPHPKTQLAKWAEEGATRVAMATPGFAADCLESLYDIKHVTCKYFETLCLQHGHKAEITYIPALNHREDHITLLFETAKQAINQLQ